RSAPHTAGESPWSHRHAPTAPFDGRAEEARYPDSERHRVAERNQPRRTTHSKTEIRRRESVDGEPKRHGEAQHHGGCRREARGDGIGERERKRNGPAPKVAATDTAGANHSFTGIAPSADGRPPSE